MVCVGTATCTKASRRFEARRWEIEDREEFTSWSDHVRLIGHFQSEHVDELQNQLQHNGPRFVFDLTEVTLVDADVVRFLGICEVDGSRNC